MPNKWPKKLRNPFRDQAEKAKRNDTGDYVMPSGYVEGAIFLNLKSSQKPHIVNQNVEDIIDKSEFYAGCWARASVNAYAYDQKGNCGVAFGLNNLQKVADGESFSGRTRPEDDFAPIEGATSSSSSESIFS